LFASMLAPLVLYQLIEGERSGLIKLFIILGGILSLKYQLSFKPRNIFLFLSVFLLFSIVGYFRGPIATSVRYGHLGPLKERIEQASPKWLFPREFAAAYFTHTASVYFDDPL